MKAKSWALVGWLLSTSLSGYAQSKLYLDLKLGANNTFAEGAYFGKGELPFKAHSPFNQVGFDEQGVVMLRLQLNEKLGIATGYSGSTLGWSYSIQMPQKYTVNPFHGEQRSIGTGVYMHQLPLLLSKTIGEYNIREIDTVRHTYLASFRLDAVLGGGLNRIGNSCLCGGLSTGGLFYDTIDFKQTIVLRRK